MGVRRASWVWALLLSIAAHGAVVAAFTPDPDAVSEAGSGAGSAVEGSIDAVIGSDVEFEELVSDELKPALDTEIAPTVEPTTMAALAPSPAEIEPVQPAAAPAAIEAAAAPEATPAEVQASALAPALAADIATTPIESDLPAAPSTEIREIVPTETLSTVAPVAPTKPATANAKPVEPSTEPPIQTALLTPAEPATDPAIENAVPEELVPLPEAKPVEAKPVETKPVEKKVTEKAEPVRKPPREKARKADRKQGAQAPSRGNAEADSIRGAAVASNTASARDSGIGRSREAGAGAAADSNYKGKVQAKIRRSTQFPSQARRLGITGRARVTFTVTPSGAAKNIVLASSTGNPMLDDAALSAVRRASPFPPMPGGMRQLDLSIPITFDLGR